MDCIALTHKKQRLHSLQPLPLAVADHLRQTFRVALAYSNNRLLGYALTRQETADILLHGKTLSKHPLSAHLATVYYGQALDQIETLTCTKAAALRQEDILHLYQCLHPTASNIKPAIDALLTWLQTHSSLHPIILATHAHHYCLEHNIFDCHTTVMSRLIFILLLKIAGYPPAILESRDDAAYQRVVATAQAGGPKRAGDNVLMRALDRSLDLCLKNAQGNQKPEASEEAESSALLRIGALAKRTGTTVPTIRHWTKEGLLEVAETSAAGYQLYTTLMAQRCAQIQSLQAERWSLQEIKKKLDIQCLD